MTSIRIVFIIISSSTVPNELIPKGKKRSLASFLLLKQFTVTILPYNFCIHEILEARQNSVIGHAPVMHGSWPMGVQAWPEIRISNFRTLKSVIGRTERLGSCGASVVMANVFGIPLVFFSLLLVPSEPWCEEKKPDRPVKISITSGGRRRRY